MSSHIETVRRGKPQTRTEAVRKGVSNECCLVQAEPPARTVPNYKDMKRAAAALRANEVR